MMKVYNNHASVLLNEVVDSLKIKQNGIYVDCTMGRGGHSDALIKVNPTITIIGVDKDIAAINFLKKKYANNQNVLLFHEDFCNICKILKQVNIKKVDGFFFDLGVSSPQFDDPDRGFSYHHDARLDMRMDQTQTLDAYYVVNHYSETMLTNIFLNFGESKESAKVAKAIVNKRANGPIETTLALVDIIKASVSKKTLASKKHPAKVFFQAIRIEVNHELDKLEQTIKNCFEFLNDFGVIAIITFHSLEDKIVKNTFNAIKQANNLPSYLPIQKEVKISCKTLYPTANEINNNKRARSAKLRVLWKE